MIPEINGVERNKYWHELLDGSREVFQTFIHSLNHILQHLVGCRTPFLSFVSSEESFDAADAETQQDDHETLQLEWIQTRWDRLVLAVQCNDLSLEQTNYPGNDFFLIKHCLQTAKNTSVFNSSPLFPADMLGSILCTFLIPQHLPLWPFKGLFKVKVGEGTPAASYYRMRQLTNVAVFTRELLLISQTMQDLMGRGLKRGHSSFLLFLQDTGRE